MQWLMYESWVMNLSFLGCVLKHFYLYHYLGKIPILTNLFQMGWDHQLVFTICQSTATSHERLPPKM